MAIRLTKSSVEAIRPNRWPKGEKRQAKNLEAVVKRYGPTAPDGGAWGLDRYEFDATQPGFYVKVTPVVVDMANPDAAERAGGEIVYYVQYVAPDGRRRKINLGTHGDDMTADKARKIAAAKRHAAAQGKDPAEERREAREGMTVSQFAEMYLARAETYKKPSSVSADKGHLKNHIKPVLGRVKIAAVSRNHVEKLHAKLQDRPVTANRVLALLSHMMTRANAWGFREAANPCRFVERYKERPRKVYLSPKQMANLAKALTEVEENANTFAHAAASSVLAIRLLIFTGCRRGEILGLHWSDVDLENKVLHLRDSKTGPKTVHLNDAAVALLNGAPRHPSGWVIPSRFRRGRNATDIKKTWKIVCDKAKIKGAHLHDLRHTHASFGVALGLGLPIVGGLLGHAQASTTERYAHLADDPLRAASNLIGAELEKAMAGQVAEVIDPNEPKEDAEATGAEE